MPCCSRILLGFYIAVDNPSCMSLVESQCRRLENAERDGPVKRTSGLDHALERITFYELHHEVRNAAGFVNVRVVEHNDSVDTGELASQLHLGQKTFPVRHKVNAAADSGSY